MSSLDNKPIANRRLHGLEAAEGGTFKAQQERMQNVPVGTLEVMNRVTCHTDTKRSARKVKCDEARPECNKCVATGRSCDGYSPGSSPKDWLSSERPLMPYSTSLLPTWTFISAQHSSVSLYSSDYERHAFNHFLRETAPALARILPMGNWVQHAVQLSVQVPAVFHAISAVGAINSAQTYVFHQTLTPPVRPSTKIPVIEQYCKATASLQKYINDAAGRNANTEPILLCCLLFICYEVIDGNVTLALSHLRHGQRTFRHLHGSHTAGAKPASLSIWSQNAVAELLSTIDQLDIEAVDIGQRGFLSSSNSFDRPTSSFAAMSLNFESVEHASEVLLSITASAAHLRRKLLQLAEGRLSAVGPYTSSRRAVRYCMIQCFSRATILETDCSLLQRKEELIKAHSAWVAMLADFHVPDQHRRLLLMQIRQFVSAFTLNTCRDITDTPTDNYSAEFRRVINLVEQYLASGVEVFDKTRKSSLGAEPQRSFSLEPGILPALFLICLKCRCPNTRKRALTQLQNIDRREGLQWSGELATYAESIAHLEEEQAQHSIDPAVALSDFSQIPEAARFLDVVIEGIGFHEVRIICGRYRHDAGGKLEIVEYKGAGVPPLVLQLISNLVVPLPPA